MTLLTGHDLTTGSACDPLGKSLARHPAPWGVRSLVLITTDGLAALAAIDTVAWIERLLRASSEPLPVPDDLIMCLVAMFAFLALVGRYVDRIPSLQGGWRLVGFVSFCVAAADGAGHLLTRGSPDQDMLLAVFPAFPIFAVLARAMAERLLTSCARIIDAVTAGADPGSSSFHGRLGQPFDWVVKGTMDVVFSGVLLVLAAPLLLAISAISCLDGGPVFFAHRRVGAGGRSFECLKFRTMVVDCDPVLEAALAASPVLAQEWKVNRKLVHDPRVTRLGKFLRSTSLDELPQLINVLRRDMSLVGPRPIVASEIDLYGEDIAYYYATRPGLTGLWQVSGRSRTSYARRVQLDVWYVSHWTIRHDLLVMLKTIPVVLHRQGAC